MDNEFNLEESFLTKIFNDFDTYNVNEIDIWEMPIKQPLWGYIQKFKFGNNNYNKENDYSIDYLKNADIVIYTDANTNKKLLSSNIKKDRKGRVLSAVQ